MTSIIFSSFHPNSRSANGLLTSGHTAWLVPLRILKNRDELAELAKFSQPSQTTKSCRRITPD